MKLLSVKQPWAWLIQHGFKDMENRSWRTHYRGPLAIHASGNMTNTDYQNCENALAVIAPDIALPEPNQLQRGGIVAFANVVDCTMDNPSNNPWHDLGAYGWKLTDVQPIPFYKMPGWQGLRDLPAEHIAAATFTRDDVDIMDALISHGDLELTRFDIALLTNQQAALALNWAVARTKFQAEFRGGAGLNCKTIVPDYPPIWEWIQTAKQRGE